MTKFVGWIHKGNASSLQSSPAPLVEDGVKVLLRGFIADREDLIAVLAPSGMPTRCLTDSQLLAAAYRRWGEQFQSRMIGEYAYVLFDEHKRTLHLGHDALGLLPLFYADTSRFFAFSSHLEGMVALTGVGALDEEYIADCLASTTHFGHRTPYRHIRRLLPGQGLVITGNGRLRTFQAYDPADVRTLNLPTRSDYVEKCRWLVDKAVRSAIPPAGKVWCELSGGLDTSTVVSIAARLPEAAIEAVSMLFSRSQTADETHWIQIALKKNPIPWHSLDADLAPPFSKFPDRFHGEPNRSLILSGFYRPYDELMRVHGVQTVLTGHGGDAVFVGDGPEPYFLADMIPAKLGTLVGSVRDWASAAPEERPSAYWLRRYGVAPAICRRLGRRVTTSPFQIPEWLRRDYVSAMRLGARQSRRRSPSGLSIGNEYFWERIRTTSHLVSIDVYQRLADFEYRSPLLYLPLVQFMLATPWVEKLRPDQDRYLQREALRGILPKEIRLRRGKSSANQTMFEGFNRNLDWIDFLTTGCHLIERGYVDAAQWQLAVAHARYGLCTSPPHFLTACILEAWFKKLAEAPAALPDLTNIAAGPNLLNW
jgi:asparagine synthase (glutamine-hydrolysing)